MVWFKVDDKAHSNNKIRKLLAAEPTALALWTVAGSWSSDNLTDGFVPEHQIPWLIPTGGAELARALVDARLWRRVRGGYQFHEWATDGDGTKRNPTRREVEDERRRKAEAGRKGGLTKASNRLAGATAGASGVLDPPTRPDHTPLRGVSGRRRATATARVDPPPPSDAPRCPRCALRTDDQRHIRDCQEPAA